jgi:hypothetical protein
LIRTQSCSGGERHQDGRKRARELYALTRWPKAHMKGMFFCASSRTVDRSRCSAS